MTPEARPAPGPPSILVVDDRSENLTALEAVLEPLGCRVVTATSGQAALKLMLEQQFAVVLLDVHMPGMDGFEVASYIRGRHRTRAVPIIFLSAVSTSAEHDWRARPLTIIVQMPHTCSRQFMCQTGGVVRSPALLTGFF